MNWSPQCSFKNNCSQAFANCFNLYEMLKSTIEEIDKQKENPALQEYYTAKGLEQIKHNYNLFLSVLTHGIEKGE